MKILILLLSTTLSVAANAQATRKTAAAAKPAKAATTKTAQPGKNAPSAAPILKTAVDSFSYALGLSMANFYKQQGISDIQTSLVIRAIQDSKSGKSLMSESEINSCIVGYMQAKRKEKSSVVRKAGEEFLAENAKKPGVVTLPSGLQYLVEKEGAGPKPTLTDKVKCHYAGSFIDGRVFESSYKNGQPVSFQVNAVIRGWTEALQLMNTGSKWKLFIPSSLGYGDADNGPIPGGSTLVFEVELLGIEK